MFVYVDQIRLDHSRQTVDTGFDLFEHLFCRAATFVTIYRHLLIMTFVTKCYKQTNEMYILLNCCLTEFMFKLTLNSLKVDSLYLMNFQKPLSCQQLHLPSNKILPASLLLYTAPSIIGEEAFLFFHQQQTINSFQQQTFTNFCVFLCHANWP